MECRLGCGACCIAPSISSPIPNKLEGKPAGEPCPHLTEGFLCRIFDQPNRPKVCAAFKADPEVCGSDRETALQILAWLEENTR